jgi:2'-5' RNA ligase
MSERIRSFIAVLVPPEAAGRIRAAQDQLRAEADGGIKWVNPEGLHLTLKFLGGVEQERLTVTWRSVAEALAGSLAFTMRFRGVGAFPSRNRARVIWVGVADGAVELAGLAQRTEAACEKHGFERETRPFSAHLTLGRVREPRPNPALAAAIAELAEAELGESPVGRVVLMESELTREGAIYRELDQVALAQSGSGARIQGQGETNG